MMATRLFNVDGTSKERLLLVHEALQESDRTGSSSRRGTFAESHAHGRHVFGRRGMADDFELRKRCLVDFVANNVVVVPMRIDECRHRLVREPPEYRERFDRSLRR